MEIFRNIEESIPDTRNGKTIIRCKSKTLDSSSLYKIASNLLFLLNKSRLTSHSILIDIQSESVKDNIVIMILEYLIYETLKNSDFKIVCRMKINDAFHTNELFKFSLLTEFLNVQIDKNRFIYKFENHKEVMKKNRKNKFSYYRVHFKYCEDKNYISKELLPPIGVFLNLAEIYEDENEQYFYNILEVISELASNSHEHAKEGFILELHVNKVSRTETYERGIVVNISLLTISNKYLYSDLGLMLENGENANQQLFYDAYNFHKDFFNEWYKKEDFLIVSAFQRGISSRFNQSGSGGTGLTRTIQHISESMKYPDDVYCYVISNKNMLFLRKNLIEESKNGIGFNKSKNYISDIPERASIWRTSFPVNGTAFYLQLFKET